MVKWDESDVEAEIIGGKADDGQHADGETGVVAIERGGVRGTVGAAGRARAKADENAGLLLLDEGEVLAAPHRA